MNGPRARSDAERRAMFARMRGRTAPARPAGPPENWTTYERDKANWGTQSWWTDYERKRRADPYGEHVDLDPPGASTGLTPLDLVIVAAYEGSREQVEGRHGEFAARVMDIAALALAYFGVKSGVTRALRSRAHLRFAVGQAFVPDPVRPNTGNASWSDRNG